MYSAITSLPLLDPGLPQALEVPGPLTPTWPHFSPRSNSAREFYVKASSGLAGFCGRFENQYFRLRLGQECGHVWVDNLQGAVKVEFEAWSNKRSLNYYHDRDQISSGACGRGHPRGHVCGA